MPSALYPSSPAMPANARSGGTISGFTLVELLVALFILSIVAVLSWRGLDGMTRAQSATQARADQVLALQVGLAQWQADLEALVPQPRQPSLDWNGRVLRILRLTSAGGEPGVIVAAWSRRAIDGQGQWLRWQSPVLSTRAQVQEAWQRADTWSQNAGNAERAREVAIVPLEQWQLFYFRGNTWSHPLSSDTSTTADGTAPPAQPPASAASGTAPATSRPIPPSPSPLPDGIRLVLTLPAGSAISGHVTMNWVSPRVAGGKS